MANIAQTINVLQAMILTEEGNDHFVRTPTYHVFGMYKGHRDAALLPITLDAGSYTHDGTTIPALSVSALTKDGQVLITLVNMDANAPRTGRVSVRGEIYRRVSGRILTAEATNAHNTFDEPNTVELASFDGAQLDDEQLTIGWPPMSIVALELE